VKILGNGELTGKMNFKVNAVSEKAKAAIEAAGGTIEVLK
jgi:large subunit ribosomal protein L15